MFFTELYELMQDGQAMNLNLLRRGERLYISLLPKVENMPQAAARLAPLSVNGTPPELDAGFMELIALPVTERLGLLSNAEAFRKETTTAREKEPAKATSSRTVEAKAPTKSEKLIAQAGELERSGRLAEAYSVYKKLLTATPQDEMLKEKAEELWKKMSQRSLFGGEQKSAPVTETGPSSPAGIPPETNAESYTDEDSDPCRIPEEDTEDMFARLVHIAGTMD